MYKYISAILLCIALCCTTVFAAPDKGNLLPEEQSQIDTCENFVTMLNDTMIAMENGAFPLILSMTQVPTGDPETAVYYGQWGVATLAIFTDTTTQRLQSIGLLLPREYVLYGYSQEGADYFACIGLLIGFFNGANQNQIDGAQFRNYLDFFQFDFITLQSQSHTVGNLEYYYEVNQDTLLFLITGVPQMDSVLPFVPQF